MIHNFNPILIDLGLVQIRWYSIAYILGILIGWIYASQILKRIKLNDYNFTAIKQLDFDNLIIYLVLGIILGGRFGYIIFYNFDYYSEHLIQIFYIWQGGMSFHGGLLGVVVAILIFSRKTNINFLKYGDIISCVAPIGIFFGRISNFINGELYGKVSNLPWAIIFPSADNLSRHPSQIYEAILEGVVLFLIINYFAFKKKLIFKTGYISSFFLISYSILRIFAEFFREPDSHIGLFFNYFSLGVILSLVTIIIGLVIILSVKKNEQNN